MSDPYSTLPAGKLPNDVLGSLLARYTFSSERVVLGPGVGRDAAVIDMGGRYLVVKTDPITFAADEIGWYLVNVNANDIATTGAQPKWLLCTALFPAGETALADVEAVFAQLSAACRSLGIALCGGHTEVTSGISRTILVGQMLGEVLPDDLVTPDRLRAGDSIVLTKGIAVEGTAILARERGAELEGLVPHEVVERAAGFLHRPGISVVREARAATRVAHLHAMHDPTEGGLATALSELAIAGNVGLRIDAASVPVLPETALLTHHFGLDPWGTIASGALLIGCAAGDAARVVDAIRAEGIWAGVIGEATEEPGALLVDEEGAAQPLPVFARDEVARLFEEG